MDVDDDGINLAIEGEKWDQMELQREYANFSQTEVMQVVAGRRILPPGVTKTAN